jgi:hypothetical protein
MMKYVVDVKALGGHRLRLRFDDGVEGVLDFAEFLEFDGLFAPHRDPEFFAKVFIFGSTIAWPNETDLDPVVLYGRVTGRDPLEVLRESSHGSRRPRRAASQTGRAASMGADAAES